MSLRLRVLGIVATVTVMVILFAWYVATYGLRVRTTPIEIEDLLRLVFPTVVLIITLVGLLLRRRANRESKPPS